MSAKKLTLILGAILVTACGQSSGSISIKLKDAPGDFKAAVVTISEIDLVGSGGVTVLSSASTTTNLLTLANDTADLVKNVNVEPGTYSELRFKISGAYVEVENSGGGTSIFASSADYAGLPANATVAGSLQMPSFAQSGLKVDLPGGSVQVGTESQILLVDFNVQQSFGQQAGGSGQWVLHPVMKATDFELSGSLTVNVALANGITLPTGDTLASFDAVLTTTNSDNTTSTTPLQLSSTGSATFKFLPPGSNYSVAIVLDPAAVVAVSFSTTPATVPVTISSGQSATASFTLSSP